MDVLTFLALPAPKEKSIVQIMLLYQNLVMWILWAMLSVKSVAPFFSHVESGEQLEKYIAHLVAAQDKKKRLEFIQGASWLKLDLGH